MNVQKDIPGIAPFNPSDAHAGVVVMRCLWEARSTSWKIAR